MHPPAFNYSSKDTPSPPWWLTLRDLLIALVVVVAIALICYFLTLQPAHAQDRPASSHAALAANSIATGAAHSEPTWRDWS